MVFHLVRSQKFAYKVMCFKEKLNVDAREQKENFYLFKFINCSIFKEICISVKPQ